jgi:REP-associated tyrosine transposase
VPPYLLELCRYIVLNPARVKGNAKASTWRWSSYRATAGLAPVAEFLRTDWILEQFGKSQLRAQQQYRKFVRDGMATRPWDDLKGQIYLGSEAFVEKHASGKKDIKEIPRAQLRAAKPSLQKIFARSGKKAIAEAYEHGYRLNEIAAHLDVHYATVSRRLKRIEQTS